MPVIFAALSYPLASVVAIAALDYIAYVAVGVAGTRPDPEHVGFFALCLGVHGRAVRLACPQPGASPRRAGARVSRGSPHGCLNRRGFEERFDAELSRALRHGRPFGLISLDLDHFKEVNDTRGHAAGDELLRWAVDVMSDTVRPMDSLGRVGGDEFSVIVPGAGPDDSAAIARRLQNALATRAPTSVGVACFPTDGADRDELQRSADTKLYAGKRGRNAPMKMTAKELSWATALARAVDERMAVQHEHSWKVAEYCVGIAERLGWTERELELLQMAAILHDVGKVSIPDHILRKQTAAHRHGVGGDPPEPGARRRDGLPHPGTRDDRAVDPPLARALRRVGLSRRPERRGDPARLPHPARGRRVRRDHERPALPRAALEAGRDGGAAPQRRHAVRPRMRRGACGVPRRDRRRARGTAAGEV